MKNITLEQEIVINNIEGEIDYIGEEIILLTNKAGKEFYIKKNEIKTIITKGHPINQLIKL